MIITTSRIPLSMVMRLSSFSQSLAVEEKEREILQFSSASVVAVTKRADDDEKMAII